MRLLVVAPLALLMVANFAGIVASITAPSHSAKKRLKAILNLDKFVELNLTGFNFLRLTIFPSKYTPRELHVSSMLHSILLLMQLQVMTKLTWDDNAPPPPSPRKADGRAMMNHEAERYYDVNQPDRPPYQQSGQYQW